MPHLNVWNQLFETVNSSNETGTGCNLWSPCPMSHPKTILVNIRWQMANTNRSWACSRDCPPKFHFRTNDICSVDNPTHPKMEPSTSASANNRAMRKLSTGRILFHNVYWVYPIVCYWVSPNIILGEEPNDWLLGASVPTFSAKVGRNRYWPNINNWVLGRKPNNWPVIGP